MCSSTYNVLCIMPEVIKSWSTKMMDGPISSLKVFSVASKGTCMDTVSHVTREYGSIYIQWLPQAHRTSIYVLSYNTAQYMHTST